jgi:hypothetical protein
MGSLVMAFMQQPASPNFSHALCLSPALQVDMFSLGVVVFELWYPQFSTGTEKAAVLGALRQKREFPAGWEGKHPKVARLVR